MALVSCLQSVKMFPNGQWFRNLVQFLNANRLFMNEQNFQMAPGYPLIHNVKIMMYFFIYMAVFLSGNGDNEVDFIEL
jgi:hypothetical protein